MKRLCDSGKLVWQDRLLLILSMILLIVYLNGVRLAQVKGVSMAPTLSDGSFHLTAPVSEPKVGDIVVFDLPDSEHVHYVKRIAAGPGDAMICGGQCTILGEDEYFMLGDNYRNSRDSRDFGPVRLEDIEAKLLF